jgi:hypothetical protein
MMLGQLIHHEAFILAFNDVAFLFVVISLGALVLAPFFRRAQSPPS